MKKNQRTPGKSILKLNRETLRALTRAQMEQVDGGTTLHTHVCTIMRCAGGNNSCGNGKGNCHED
ncbi:MAG TPA: class I lanthipeptide [Haliangium sp.]|nr:class I lanthipeptide [Haliangium sp.]